MGSFVFDYYLALLQVQVAILGIVVAGLVTLMQILSTAVPKRHMKLLARPMEMVFFVAGLSLLIAVLAVGTWATAFAAESSLLLEVFSGKLFGMVLLLLCMGSLAWFTTLMYRTRRLLDARLYLRRYIRRTSAVTVLHYVEKIHKLKPANAGQNIESKLYDPFQPIREYIKHNAQQQYDYGTAAGLKFFSQLFDKTFYEIPHTDTRFYGFLAEHFAKSAVEFYRVFIKTSSEKRRMDVIRLVQAKAYMFLEAHDDKSFIVMVRALEDIGQMSQEENEVVTIVEAVHNLTNAYLALHENTKWHEVGEDFEEICLSLTRLAEAYYLRDAPMHSMPLISYYTGKTKSAGVALVKFFTAYKHLAHGGEEVRPKLYFDAVEALCEVLYARARALDDSGKAAIGLNGNTHMLTAQLYDIYREFGLQAVQHQQADMLGLSLGNLRRLVKSANKLKLVGEQKVVTQLITELTVTGIEIMGDVAIKGDRTITEYSAEALQKHAHAKDVREALVKLDNNSEAAERFRNALGGFAKEV